MMRPVRFNASEIGEITGFLTRYKPNDSLPRLICRDNYAYLATRYQFKVPVKTRDVETFGSTGTQIADEFAKAVVSLAEKSVPEGYRDSVREFEEFEHGMADDIIKSIDSIVSDESEVFRIARSLPLFPDSTDILKAVIEPRESVSKTPANSFADKMTADDLMRARAVAVDTVRSVLSTAGSEVSKIHENIRRETYTRHGTRSEDETLLRISEYMESSISTLPTIGITLEPEEIFYRFNVYTEIPIRITGRPDGVLESTGQYIEVKNRVNFLSGEPRKYELPQVLVYGLMSGKPVLFTEMHMNTGKMNTVDIEYSDAKLAPYIEKLVKIAEYIERARNDSEELEMLSRMNSDELSKYASKIMS